MERSGHLSASNPQCLLLAGSLPLRADVAWGSRDLGSQSPAHSKYPLAIFMKDGQGCRVGGWFWHSWWRGKTEWMCLETLELGKSMSQCRS